MPVAHAYAVPRPGGPAAQPAQPVQFNAGLAAILVGIPPILQQILQSQQQMQLGMQQTEARLTNQVTKLRNASGVAAERPMVPLVCEVPGPNLGQAPANGFPATLAAIDTITEPDMDQLGAFYGTAAFAQGTAEQRRIALRRYVTQ